MGISGRKFGDGPVHEATDEGFDIVMHTNVKTTFVMCREVLRHMLPRKQGSIVNTASVLAYAPDGEHFGTHAYAASKGALISLSKAMASSYARQGIRVNVLAPGSDRDADERAGTLRRGDSRVHETPSTFKRQLR